MSSGIYVLLVLFFLSNGIVQGKTHQVDKLISLHKIAVKTIRSEDGDIIDCIDIHKQPAFDHPALRNHTIQMRPNFSLPKNISKQEDKLNSEQAVAVTFQTWQASGSCPERTVPIIRVKKTLRGFSVGKKKILVTGNNSSVHFNPNAESNNNVSIGFLPNRASATLVTVGYNYIGASADINVWEPHVQRPDEYSTGQIWLQGGPGNNFESVEAGWVVNPKLYGDTKSRLFTYWTKDGYKTTGCFNVFCSGFVQISQKIYVGAKIDPISSRHGPQYQISVRILQDQATTNWWLMFGDESVGYWPGNMFGYLSHTATLVQWGGEVYSESVKKTPHTRTEMGSGSFASALFGFACHISYPRIMDFSQSFKYPDWVGTWADESYCYNPLNYREGIVGEPVFYFGGPGQNPNCP